MTLCNSTLLELLAEFRKDGLCHSTSAKITEVYDTCLPIKLAHDDAESYLDITIIVHLYDRSPRAGRQPGEE